MSLILDGTAGVTFPNSTVQASAGSVLQVVNATYSTNVSNSTSTYADTGLTATITPKFTTSKILVIVSQNGGINSPTTTSISLKLVRGATDLIFFVYNAGYTGAAGNFYHDTIGGTFLDSPATISATTYKTQFNSRSGGAVTQFQDANSSSTITLMEIAG